MIWYPEKTAKVCLIPKVAGFMVAVGYKLTNGKTELSLRTLRDD
jgi:hypothetical protein